MSATFFPVSRVRSSCVLSVSEISDNSAKKHSSKMSKGMRVLHGRQTYLTIRLGTIILLSHFRQWAKPENKFTLFRVNRFPAFLSPSMWLTHSS